MRLAAIFVIHWSDLLLEIQFLAIFGQYSSQQCFYGSLEERGLKAHSKNCDFGTPMI